MGSSHSYVTDPSAFSTEVKENDDISHWKSYDYVVVGGGAFHDRSHDRQPLTNEPPQGTAGSGLSSSLSQNTKNSFLFFQNGEMGGAFLYDLLWDFFTSF